MSRSVTSVWLTDTVAGRPNTAAAEPEPSTSMMFAAPVPNTSTVSNCASPVVPPIVPDKVDGDVGDLGAGQVVDVDIVGAGAGIDDDLLEIVQVHRDHADVAGQDGAAAIGADDEILVGAVAVEQQGVAVRRRPPPCRCRRRDPTGRRRCRRRAKAKSLPWLPSTKSLPSPAMRMSVPLPARMTSSPEPPLMVRPIRAARLPLVLIVSLPPLAKSTSSSVVPISSANGERIDAVEGHARAVGGDGEGLGAVAADDLGVVAAVAALHHVAAVAGLPDHDVAAGLAEHRIVAGAAGQRVVLGAAQQQVGAAAAGDDVVAALAAEGQAGHCRPRGPRPR